MQLHLKEDSMVFVGTLKELTTWLKRLPPEITLKDFINLNWNFTRS